MADAPVLHVPRGYAVTLQEFGQRSHLGHAGTCRQPASPMDKHRDGKRPSARWHAKLAEVGAFWTIGDPMRHSLCSYSERYECQQHETTMGEQFHVSLPS